MAKATLIHAPTDVTLELSVAEAQELRQLIGGGTTGTNANIHHRRLVEIKDALEKAGLPVDYNYNFNSDLGLVHYK